MAVLKTAGLQELISKIKTEFESYYTKSETYTQAEVNNLVSTIPKFGIEVVDALPTTDISTTTVYLLKNTEEGSSNLYTEYIYVNDAWEKLGTQDIDLSGYVTTTTFDEKVGTDTLTTTAQTLTGAVNEIEAELEAYTPVLYTEKGTNTDGAMTQLATTRLIFDENDYIQIGDNLTNSSSAGNTSYQECTFVGNNAVYAGRGGTAIGDHARAYGGTSTATTYYYGATAVGHWAMAQYESNLALGSKAWAVTGGKQIAIGAGSRAGGTTYVAGTPSEVGAIALGWGATASAEDAFSAGTSSRTTGEWGITLGANSTTSGGGGITIGQGATNAGEGAITIGSANSTTGELNILIGEIGEELGGSYNVIIGSGQWSSSDAFTTKENVLIGRFTGGYNLGDVNTSGDQNIILGSQRLLSNSTSSTTAGCVNAGGAIHTVVIGAYNTVGSHGEGGVVIGDAATIGQDTASDVNGTNGAVAIGQQANASYGESVALGKRSVTTKRGQVSVGALDDTTSTIGYNDTPFRLISGVYPGVEDNDAVTVSQLNDAVAGVDSEEITAAEVDEMWG